MAVSDSDTSSTPTFSQLVFSDFMRYESGRTPSWYQVVTRSLTMTGLVASVIVRAQQSLWHSGHIRLAWILRSVGIVLVGADFAPGMTIGTGLYLPHPVGVVIGNGLRIGNNVMLAQGVTVGLRTANRDEPAEYATICDGATIWSHATIVGCVRIGENSEIGANSLVVADVPDNAIVVGVPARKIGEVDPEHPPQSGTNTLAPAPQ
jgi:serine O-acetyltransferase